MFFLMSKEASWEPCDRWTAPGLLSEEKQAGRCGAACLPSKATWGVTLSLAGRSRPKGQASPS